MSNARLATIIGIGSPHGDDQFGWAVVDRIAAFELRNISLHKVQCPFDIIELLEESDHVTLIDAAIGLPVTQNLLKLHYADDHDKSCIEAIPHAGTHDFGLGQVLRLAQSLGKRTDHVSLWIADGGCFKPLMEMTDRIKQCVEGCAVAVTEELCDARNVTH